MKKSNSKNKDKWWLWTKREGIAVSYCNLRDSAHPFYPEFKKFANTYLGHIFLWEGDDISIYWKQKDLDNFSVFFFAEIEKGDDFLDQLERYHFENGKKLIEYSRNFDSIDFSQKSNEELIEYLDGFKKYYENLALYTYIPVIATFAIEDALIPYLKSKLKDRKTESEFGKYFSKLSYSPGKSWARLEEEDLWKIAQLVKQGETINGSRVSLKLQRHANEFGWQSLGYQFLGPVMKADEFIPRLKKIIKDGLDDLPSDEEVVNDILKIEKNLDIDDRHRNLFRALRRIIYLKEYRDGIYTRSHQYINILLKEIVERFEIPFDVSYFMKLSEFRDLVDGRKIDFDKIAQRKEIFMWKCDGKEEYYSGKEARKVITKEIGNIIDDSENNINELSGVIASSGLAKGVVKIVYNEKDVRQVGSGNILVAHMTKPSYLGGMRKASAFVTDEGGITCHAAIVSREMKKPCIIGTKIATQVLKDGDLVEVDAQRGVVRILESVE